MKNEIVFQFKQIIELEVKKVYEIQKIQCETIKKWKKSKIII